VASKSEKKVVHVEAETPVAREGSAQWKPTGEAKGKATTLRIIAAVLWALAIGAEAFAIFWLLRQDTTQDWFLWAVIGALVVIAILAIVGSMLWKKANRYDPAKKSDKFRFFVQNQFGLIITVIAFLPLIILIFMNKDMDGKQKGIAGGIAIGLLVIAGLFGISWNPPSVEENTAEMIANEGQVDEYTAIVGDLTGGDEVFWTPQGTVYHICSDVPELQQESQDAENNVIKSGTVAAAHSDGKEGLTLEIQDELEACALPVPDNVDAIVEEVRTLRTTVEEDNAG
jgi:hypothetical protein